MESANNARGVEEYYRTPKEWVVVWTKYTELPKNESWCEQNVPNAQRMSRGVNKIYRTPK